MAQFWPSDQKVSYVVRAVMKKLGPQLRRTDVSGQRSTIAFLFQSSTLQATDFLIVVTKLGEYFFVLRVARNGDRGKVVRDLLTKSRLTVLTRRPGGFFVLRVRGSVLEDLEADLGEALEIGAGAVRRLAIVRLRKRGIFFVLRVPVRVRSNLLADRPTAAFFQ